MSLGCTSKSRIHACYLRISLSPHSFSNLECPDVPEEDTPDTRAIELVLTSPSICYAIFLQRVEGPGSP